VEKTKEMYVLPKLINCIYATPSFNLWMSKGAQDIFALVIRLVGMQQQKKKCVKNSRKFPLFCPIRFVKMYNLTQKI
jgi:hypothetical protein